jgi:hypothetical protein
LRLLPSAPLEELTWRNELAQQLAVARADEHQDALLIATSAKMRRFRLVPGCDHLGPDRIGRGAEVRHEQVESVPRIELLAIVKEEDLPDRVVVVDRLQPGRDLAELRLER